MEAATSGDCAAMTQREIDRFIIAYNKYLLEHGEKPRGSLEKRQQWYKGLMKALKEIE